MRTHSYQYEGHDDVCGREDAHALGRPRDARRFVGRSQEIMRAARSRINGLGVRCTLWP
jgi:hypothetical protein